MPTLQKWINLTCNPREGILQAFSKSQAYQFGLHNTCCEPLPTFALHTLRGGSFDPKISCFSLTRSQIYRTISNRPNLTNNSVQRANPGVPTGFVQSDSI